MTKGIINTNAIRAFPPMSRQEIAKQPQSVWREVEREAMRFKGSTIKQVVGVPTGQPMQPGWLKEEDFTHLLALDVPITKLFTAVAARQRLTTGRE